MALKPIFFLIASLLVVTTRVLSTNEELLMEAKVPAPGPAHSSVKVLPPPPPPPFPITPPPAVPPVKPPVLPPPPVTPPPTKPPPIECTPLCVERCKLHSRKNLCWRACVTCCNRCKCVPPGTYGNREKCGKCYTNMTTRGGKRKCP